MSGRRGCDRPVSADRCQPAVRLRRLPRRPPVAELPTGTLTFLCTDIEGSAKLWVEHPSAIIAAMARHDACLRTAIEASRGTVFKTIGDGFAAVFTEPTDALAAALAAQQSLRQTQRGSAPGETELTLKVGMGLHTG